jgi:hypothetical protein
MESMLWALMSHHALGADSISVSHSESASQLGVFELIVDVSFPQAINPFRYRDLDGTPGGISVVATFTSPTARTSVIDGFADRADGTLFKVRFCPSEVGTYQYSLTYTDDGGTLSATGTFSSTASNDPGFLIIDPEFPYSFKFSHSGEHFFHLGATAYALLGQSISTIKSSIDLAARYKFNKIRFQMAVDSGALYGTPTSRWQSFFQYPFQSVQWYDVNPFLGAGVTDYANTDYDRYNVETYKKAEETIAYMKSKGIIAHVIFLIEKDGLPDRLGESSPREYNYYRYTVARLAAYSNIVWDLGNEHNEYRTVPDWANDMGSRVRNWDPYDHLISVHAYEDFFYYDQLWAGWGTHQNSQRTGAEIADHIRSNRIHNKPVVNEEYGYEREPGYQGSDGARDDAWSIALSGGYGTYGHGENGNFWHGDLTYGQVLPGYTVNRVIHDFMSAYEWWRYSPAQDRLSGNSTAQALADPSTGVLVYVADGKPVTVDLAGFSGMFSVTYIRARDGVMQAASMVPGGERFTTIPPFAGDDYAISIIQSASVAFPLITDDALHGREQ